jgi:hypothetical protein
MEKDSDSVKSRMGEDESKVGLETEHYTPSNDAGLPQDPDAGLSEEEKAQIVRK